MYRALPVANRICYQAEKDRLMAHHMAALRRIRGEQVTTTTRGYSNGSSLGHNNYKKQLADIASGQSRGDGKSKVTKNHRLIQLVASRTETSNAEECILSRLDHQYQVNRKSQFRKTVPMTTIVRRELHLPPPSETNGSTRSGEENNSTTETESGENSPREAMNSNSPPPKKSGFNDILTSNANELVNDY